MSTVDPISPDLKAVLRRLKLGPILNTLPERLTLARQQKMPHQDFMLLVLADEVARRDSVAVSSRATKAGLDPTMRLELWDASAKVTYDHLLFNELTALRFGRRTPTSPSSARSAWARLFWPMRSVTLPVAAAMRCSPKRPTSCSRRCVTRASIAPTRPSCASAWPSICSWSTISASTP